MSGAVDAYWIGRSYGGVYACPNVNLFRFLGKTSGPLDGKRVLEVGFGHGEDLLECHRRGAEVYGLDLNYVYVESLKHIPTERISAFKAGIDRIPFQVKFELIYSHDMIYYLGDENIRYFFEDCCNNLTDSGKIIIQFIESDLQIDDHVADDFDPRWLNKSHVEPIFPKENPIRFLRATHLIDIARQVGLAKAGAMRVIQTYDLDERVARVTKYLAFSKAGCC